MGIWQQIPIPEPINNRSDGMIHTKEFKSYADMMEYMRLDAESKGHKLMSGVGNDMSTPYYTFKSVNAVNYWPNGIGKGLEILGVMK